MPVLNPNKKNDTASKTRKNTDPQRVSAITGVKKGTRMPT